jgi:PAS domain S-box-containing protein
MPAEDTGAAGAPSCYDNLVESRERYASLFTYHPHAAYSLDRRGYFTDANPRALEMTGLSLEEMKQTHFSEIIHPEDVHLMQAGFEKALAREPQVVDARVVSADGDIVDIRCTGIPVVVGDEVVGVHGVTEDTTAAKQMLRDLEAATAAKTLFLANVSHELRTPLTSIINATDLLLDADLDPDPAHLVRMVHRNGERLLRLVSDILDFSRLEAGQVVLRPRPFDLREVVDGLAEWAVPLAESRGLTLSITVDESVPPAAVGDGLRISQVLTNLVHNAIKFTCDGGVRVDARVLTEAPSTHAPDLWAEFRVTDTGIGIEAERLQELFEPFTQADPSPTRGYAGAGLGLAICTDLVELMGGQIRAISEVGRGTTFVVGIPLGHSAEAELEHDS